MLLLGSSCCKKVEKLIVPHDAEFLSYFHFPGGGYWIFKETSTGEKDSTYTFNFNTYRQDNPDIEFRLGEGVGFDELYYGEFMRGDTSGSRVSLNIYNRETGYGTWVKYASRTLYNYNVDLFWYIPNDQTTYGTAATSNGQISKEYLDSLEIQGTVYHDVVHFVNPSAYPTGIITEVWYAKNIGPIKRRFTDNTEWELLAYALY